MLPHLLPMLAVSGTPFDSAEHLFEVKWDGVRALAALDADGWRLWGRERSDYTLRYPELAALRAWPEGTLVDGELVAFQGGRPDLALLMRRHHLAAPWKIEQARRWCPVHYLVFDLLYHAGRCLLRESLKVRRELLAEMCVKVPVPGVVFSPGIIGNGRALYEQAVTQGQEGVMAKLLTSTYRPGQRSPAWRKIKPKGRK